MAFSHLINCLLLTYGPYFVAYKAKGLAEQGAYKTVLMALVGCLVTQFCKLFLLASFSVLIDQFLQIKVFFDLLDCYGIYFLQKQIKTDNKYTKILAIAIGWSFMDQILKNLFTFIPHATTDEFTWAFILRGINANLEFFESIYLVGLVQQFEQPISLLLILGKVLALPLLEELPLRAAGSLLYIIIARFMVNGN